MIKTKQSFQNLKLAFEALKESVATPPIENRDYAGIIQSFEFTYELTWKTLKLILEGAGISAPFPRVCFEEAFKAGLLYGNEEWKNIMEDRNLSTHTYNQTLARQLCKKITNEYVLVFELTISNIEKYMAKLV
jgi:nucleotidyltransferase substrate binding protein (TIGR01987 family)